MKAFLIALASALRIDLEDLVVDSFSAGKSMKKQSFLSHEMTEISC
jgi:hypothetical protein